MDVRPTKNAIFIAIDPCLHILLVTKFSLDLQLRASVPQELHRMTDLQGNTRRELQKKKRWFQIFPNDSFMSSDSATYSILSHEVTALSWFKYVKCYISWFKYTFHDNCWTSFPSAHMSTPHQSSFSSRSPHLQVWARSTQPPSRNTQKSLPP